MYKSKKGFELAISGLLPFMALAMLMIVEWINLGFKPLDSSFVLKLVVNCIALLAFFLPFKTIFVDKYMAGERIIKKQDEYAALVDKIFDSNQVKVFENALAVSYTKRKADYIDKTLSCIGMSVDEFNKCYLGNSKAIKAKQLGKHKSKILKKLNKNIDRIRETKISDVLPSTEAVTTFNELPSNMERASRSYTLRKIGLSVLASIAITVFIITPNESTNIVPIIANVIMKIITGLGHIFIASRVADKLVNKVYFNELSEKIFVIEKTEILK